ncbi:hypothetical protein ACXYX3_18455 [Mycobacterium sp. C3-094]
MIADHVLPLPLFADVIMSLPSSWPVVALLMTMPRPRRRGYPLIGS